ncbi:hypothetical protein GCM10007301_07900 [Azorhizobium oxalatiphilum]|uniref:Uncharacterized protein n=1 Tax=Azorhizobium oxalatiphilum TaxID=980631 RepID=A0A917BNL0_9HYPH|nr:hypothetical protein [Azorhizobium oxalatiphilum]GGF50926.1 hypothetical protein GCM10007301_07900 [Azorhizobium oxalatiphilum]
MPDTFRLDDVKTYLDPSAVLLTADHADAMPRLPAYWQPYLSPDHGTRMAHLKGELSELGAVLPKAAVATLEMTRDVFLVRYQDARHGPRIARIYNQASWDDAEGEQLYSAISRAPLPAEHLNSMERAFLDRAPPHLTRVYRELFDGFESILGGGGLSHLGGLHTLAELGDAYGEQDWYADFIAGHDPALVYEVYSNGGGVNILLDLNAPARAKAEEPVGILVDVKDRTFQPDMEMWDLMDTMTSISVSGK